MNYIRFSHSYDAGILSKELEAVLEERWPLHYNQQDYNGDWRSIALRSSSGKQDDILAHPGAVYQDTVVLAQMPYVKSILDSWSCEKEAVRLLALAPGSEIKPHRDLGCSYNDGSFRIHIPITTNPQVHFTLGEAQLQLAPGECWYLDFDVMHSIINAGETNRVHLIIDGIRNSWTDELFKAHGYPVCNDETSYDEATQAMVIEELQRMDTPYTRALIENLKAKNICNNP